MCAWWWWWWWWTCHPLLTRFSCWDWTLSPCYCRLSFFKETSAKEKRRRKKEHLLVFFRCDAWRRHLADIVASQAVVVSLAAPRVRVVHQQQKKSQPTTLRVIRPALQIYLFPQCLHHHHLLSRNYFLKNVLKNKDQRIVITNMTWVGSYNSFSWSLILLKKKKAIRKRGTIILSYYCLT